MNILLLLIVIFSGIGVLDALYIGYHRFRGTDVKCIFFPHAWCQKVLRSKQSKTFGIPNAVSGFLMYLGILLGTLLYWQGMLVFLPVRLLIILGFLFSIYFIYLQRFVIRAFCTWCVLSALNFCVMFAAQFFI